MYLPQYSKFVNAHLWKKWKATGCAYLLEVPELTLRLLGGTARLHAFEDKGLDLVNCS